MKRSLFTSIILLLLTINCFSQKNRFLHRVNNSKSNIISSQYYNEIYFFDLDTNLYKLQIKNLDVIWKSPNTLFVRPIVKSEDCKVEFFEKSSKKLSFSKDLFVQDFILFPQINLVGNSNTEKSRFTLSGYSKGIACDSVPLLNLDKSNVTFEIVSFHFNVINDEKIESVKNEGPNFSNEVKSLILKCNYKSKAFLTEIVLSDTKGNTLIIPKLELYFF